MTEVLGPTPPAMTDGPPPCASANVLAAHTPHPPKAPVPASDPAVVPRIGSLSLETLDSPDGDFDAMTMDAGVALKLLSKAAQGLVEVTGDVPPTPALQGQNLAALHSFRSSDAGRTLSRPGTPASNIPADEMSHTKSDPDMIGSPEAHHSEHHWAAVAAENEKLMEEQRGAVARKFFSKKPPPISVTEYLARLHRYCPMSTAVYLAACVYMYRLAIEDRSVPVTPRTVHRLVLACLRVAMKALEDLSYPHQRFAGVGGVSEKELAKLEIALCYLMEFQLRVDNDQLAQKARALLQLAEQSPVASGAFKLQLPPPKKTVPVESKG